MTAMYVEKMITNKTEAIAKFKALTAKYGMQWTAAVPDEAYKEMQECNMFLDVNDRRAALGFSNL